MHHGLDAAGAHKIAGYLAVNPEDADEVRSALYTFGNFEVGMELPNTFDLNPKATWDVGGPSNPEKGHEFVLVGSTQEGFLTCTWGFKTLITSKALAKYANSDGGECYVAVSHDSLSALSGLNPIG